jgi:hypothetical protein
MSSRIRLLKRSHDSSGCKLSHSGYAAMTMWTTGERASRGDAALKIGDKQQAADEYLMAVACGDRSAADPLADVWIEQGRNADAVLARQALTCAGVDLGDAQWARVEKWLADQGAPVAPCADDSKEPVEIPWLE